MRTLYFFIFVILEIVIFSACKKETTDEPYSFSFDMNNKHYSVDSLVASIDTANAAPPIGYYIPAQRIHMGKGRWFGQADSINLIKGDVITVNFVCLNFSLSPDSILGNFRSSDGCFCGKVFTPSFNIYSHDNNVKGQYGHAYANSSLSVTEINNVYIAGTFYSTLSRRHNNVEDTVRITNGKFKVPF